jgi:Na+/alanine symporter
MIKKIEDQLALRDYKFYANEQGITIKTFTGYFNIDVSESIPKLSSRYNYKMISVIITLIFFVAVVIDNHFEGSPNDMYVMIVLLFSLYLLYGLIIQNMHKQKVYDIIERAITVDNKS